MQSINSRCCNYHIVVKAYLVLLIHILCCKKKWNTSTSKICLQKLNIWHTVLHACLPQTKWSNLRLHLIWRKARIVMKGSWPFWYCSYFFYNLVQFLIHIRWYWKSILTDLHKPHCSLWLLICTMLEDNCDCKQYCLYRIMFDTNFKTWESK